jgi:hypothetical protein
MTARLTLRAVPSNVTPKNIGVACHIRIAPGVNSTSTAKERRCHAPRIPTGALFEQLRPRLTAISRRIVGSEAEAEDVVQDCFLKWHRAEQGAGDACGLADHRRAAPVDRPPAQARAGRGGGTHGR